MATKFKTGYLVIYRGKEYKVGHVFETRDKRLPILYDLEESLIVARECDLVKKEQAIRVYRTP